MIFIYIHLNLRYMRECRTMILNTTYSLGQLDSDAIRYYVDVRERDNEVVST